MKNVNSLFCLLIGLILMSSCSLFIDYDHDCPPRETKTFKMLDNDKSRIPYNTGFDTLSFMHFPSSEVHSFYGLGMLNGFSQVHYSRDIECPPDIANCEYQTYKYESPTISDAIFIAYYKDGPYGGTNANFRFKAKTFEKGMGYFGVTVSYTTLVIQGKTFNNVYRISGTENYDDTTSYLLYTNLDGIIKIKFSNQDYWEMVK